jgi:Spy/CpxP family protein refolding chaperone
MICLALGLGILGFAAARKARRCHRGYGGGCGGHWHGWHGWHHHHHGHHGGWRGGFGRRGLYMALSRLDATPAQERAIVQEVERLQDRLRSAKTAVKDARPDLAAAIRGPSLDDAALGAVLGRIDTATTEARAAVTDALRNIHGLLDDRQREQVADLLDNGWWRRGGGGPYRV